jgi:hypothetical protein
MPYWLQFTLFAIISGLVQYIIAFFKKKGENLATKQDIKGITDSIKSVESKYNSSLEAFKMELLNEHEFSKSLFEICNNLDKELINCLIKCKKDIEMDGSYEAEGEYGNALKSINDLGDFLHSYESRYSNLKDFNKLIKECDNMYAVYIDFKSGTSIQHTNYRPVTEKAQKLIKNILKTIIPPIKVSNIKEPEFSAPAH